MNNLEWVAVICCNLLYSETGMTLTPLWDFQVNLSCQSTVIFRKPPISALTWTREKSHRSPARLQWWASQSAPQTRLQGRNWWPSSCVSGRRSGRSSPAQWQRRVQQQTGSTAEGKKTPEVVKLRVLKEDKELLLYLDWRFCSSISFNLCLLHLRFSIRLEKSLVLETLLEQWLHSSLMVLILKWQFCSP